MISSNRLKNLAPAQSPKSKTCNSTIEYGEADKEVEKKWKRQSQMLIPKEQ